MAGKARVWTVLAYFVSGKYSVETYDFESVAREYYALLCKDFIDGNTAIKGAAILSPDGVLTNTHGITPSDTARKIQA